MDLPLFDYRIVHTKFIGFQNIKIQKSELPTGWNPSQTVWICRLAWFYTGGKGKSFLVPEG
jgi:hypothetical protein